MLRFVLYKRTARPHPDCLRIVVGKHFKVELTPSALESGASQRDQITALIEGCAFAVVILDGLRPNVVFEYGILHGRNKPVILLKGEKATVDIRSFYGDDESGPYVAVALKYASSQ